mmetsp:Transcript_7631/g.16457  ORF Transcript_7631/g.16457 Transcript_7631/m.16457 type:complete len:97 (+) Transcript_7631:37-327(+)
MVCPRRESQVLFRRRRRMLSTRWQRRKTEKKLPEMNARALAYLRIALSFSRRIEAMIGKSCTMSEPGDPEDKAKKNEWLARRKNMARNEGSHEEGL